MLATILINWADLFDREDFDQANSMYKKAEKILRASSLPKKHSEYGVLYFKKANLFVNFRKYEKSSSKNL